MALGIAARATPASKSNVEARIVMNLGRKDGARECHDRKLFIAEMM